LLALLDSGNAELSYLELGRDIIVGAGAREYCEQLITEHVDTAIAAIKNTSLATTQKAIFIDMAQQLCLTASKNTVKK